jgi:hypothetical protein
MELAIIPSFQKHHINQYVNWITQPTLLRASARQAYLLTLRLQEVRDDGKKQLYAKNRHHPCAKASGRQAKP